MKEGGTRRSFIHLNKVDHQTNVAAEVLVNRGGNAGRESERERGRGRGREREAGRAMGKASQL